jgi:hypothetical protein
MMVRTSVARGTLARLIQQAGAHTPTELPAFRRPKDS